MMSRWAPFLLLVVFSSCRVEQVKPEDQSQARPVVVQAKPAAGNRTHQVVANKESQAYHLYMLGVGEELDARMSQSEKKALALLEKSIAHFEQVIELGFATPELHLRLARNLKIFASRASNAAERKSLLERIEEHYQVAMESEESIDPLLEEFLAFHMEVLGTGLKPMTNRLEEFLSKHPDSDGLRLKLGEAYLKQQHFQEALEQFQVLTTNQPEQAFYWLYRGRAELGLEKFEEAYQSFKQVRVHAVGLEELAFEAMRSQVLCLRALGRHQESAAILKELVEKQPDVAENWVEYARLQLGREEFPEAEKSLNRALMNEPRNFLANVLLGQVQLAQDRKEEGLERLNRLATMWPDAPESWMVLGEALLGEGEAETALPHLEKAWQIRPDRQSGMLLAEAFRQTGNITYAEKLLEELNESYPEDVDILRNLFFFKLDEGKYEECLSIARGLHASHEGYLTHYMMGAAHERLGNLEEGIEHLKMAIELKPDFANARNYLGYLYAENGIHLEESVQEIQMALELEPGNGAYLDSLGWAYFKLGELRKSLFYLRQAVEKMAQNGDEDAVIFEHLGDVYFEMSCFSKAQESWKSALAIEKSEEKRELLNSKLGRSLSEPDAQICFEESTVDNSAVLR